MTRLLVIDTETGGTDPYAHSLLSLGAVVWDDGALGGHIEILVGEEELSVTPEAMNVNRIDLASHRETAMRPEKAITAFESFVRTEFHDALAQGDRVVLAGHNVGFDVGFLKRLYRESRRDRDYDCIFSHRTLDTAGILRFLSLVGIRTAAAADSTTAFAELGIPIEDKDRHTALGDAAATAILLTRLIALTRDGGRNARPDATLSG